MSELWIRLPASPFAPEASLTIALAIAIAIHAVPLLAVDPELGAPLELTPVDEGCCFQCWPDEPDEPDELDEGVGAFRLPSSDALSERERDPARGRVIEEAELGSRAPPTLALTTAGALHRATVRSLLRRQLDAFRRCLVRAPSLTLGEPSYEEPDGTVAFEIGATGRAGHLATSFNPDAASCLERTLAALAFPRATGPTDVQLRLRYGTTEASAGVFVR